MTRSPDPHPQHPEDGLLLDALLGALSDAEADALAARLDAEPALAGRHAAFAALLAAEREAFQPDARPGWDEATEAARVAARVRAAARSQASVKRTAVRDRARTPQGRWARILAFSVGAHVVLLGALAYVLPREPAAESRGTPMFEIETSESLFDRDPVDTEIARAYPHLTWRDVASIPDELVLREQETYKVAELPEELTHRRDPAMSDPKARRGSDRHGLFDQPVGVVIAATRRTDLALKRRRLDLLGFNSAGTLRAVEKGLGYLAGRQEADGSFPTPSADGSRGSIEQTAIALLAFLGDGHASHGQDRDGAAQAGHGLVVAKGVRWLRDRLFNASDTDDDRAAHLAGHELAVVGPATVALCEDYMLSYGWLSPAAAEVRAREIAELAGHIKRLGGESSVERPWAVWGADAAARVGVVGSTATHQRRFAAWVERAGRATPNPASPLSILSVGTALLFAERGVEKPRFLAWSRDNARDLAARLGPHGHVRTGDEVGDTALVLLGLQVAYRTY